MGVPSHRKALAGVLMAQGETQRAALIQVGYSPVTASKPKANGLAADRCIGEAKKAGLVPDMATIHDRVIHLAHAKLDRLQRSDKQLDNTRLGEIARLLDVTAKQSAGSKDNTARDVRGFLDRVEWLAELQREATARGLSLGQGESASPNPPETG